MPSNAAIKRYAALKAFSDKYRPLSNGYRLLETVKVADMIADIEEMRKLGRTERWQNVLINWVAMINERPENADHLEWATLQGAIYVGYECE